jgi:aspartate-semialdehyde dehydrogenase
MVYPYKIDRNCIPHCDIFLENDYTKEEMKMTQETVKIIGHAGIKLSATAVRVPVQGGHSESVNVEFEREFTLEAVRKILNDTPGITLQDRPEFNTYPMPLMAEGKDDVFVGRLRRDFTTDRALNLWIVSDNLRKGAATNTVQIAEVLLKKGFIG